MDRRTYVEDTLLPHLLFSDTKLAFTLLATKKEAFIAKIFNTKDEHFSNNDFSFRPEDFRLWIVPQGTKRVLLIRMPHPVQPPQSAYIAAIIDDQYGGNPSCKGYVTLELNADGGFFICLKSSIDTHMILDIDCGSSVATALTALMEYLDIKGEKTSQAYLPIFAEIYGKALSILSSQSLVRNAEFELLPAMFVVVDCSCISAKKNRETVGRGLRAYITRQYRLDNLNNLLFDKRTVFYGSIIRKRPLRADWLLGQQASVQNANPIVRCAIALGDILINPDCAKDYDNAPALLYGAFDMADFAGLYTREVIPLFMELFNRIYDADI